MTGRNRRAGAGGSEGCPPACGEGIRPAGGTDGSAERLENILFLVLVTVIAMMMRVFLFPIESGDYLQFLHPWYETLRENGGLLAIGMDIGDYMPPYFYILALLTYLPVRDLYAIKIVSSLVDLLLAVFAANLASDGKRLSRRWMAVYCVVLFLPSVFLNSAVWGQCDAIYVSALLAFLYYVHRGRSNAAVLAYSISFVFKLQAVFLAPLLLLLLLKRRVRWQSLWILPTVYLAACLPAAVMGRNLWDLLTVYFSQAGQYNLLAMFLPNLYTWLGDSTSAAISHAGVMLAGGVLLCTVFFLYRLDFTWTLDNLVSIGLFFALLTPFLLPHMHERYYFLADLLSVIFVFRFPGKWGVAFTVCMASAYAVCHNLFGTDFFPVELLGVILFGVICFVVRHLAVTLPRREAAA